ncbi:MAG: S1 RNA-binding domain-containing protein [Lachnospiraceae bacterium]|nr:S1 RNA-binding domain-containing protein [Lachnospiraceae bacterium]
MFNLGEYQKLKAFRREDFGMLFIDGDNKDEKILLPKAQVPEDMKVGDEAELFIYKDSSDRPIATINKPLITLGEIALLKVVSLTKIGAFLDWGLEKDLLLPFKEQTGDLRAGDDVLVSLYIDKSKRLCATMKLYHHFSEVSSYKKDDWVEGRVYELSGNFGAFVAVDDKYSALIPKQELSANLKVGDKVKGRVIEVTEDGRLTLSIREKAYIQMAVDAQKVLDVIDSFDGVLPFNDKANPEVIKREMGMSKNEFKRAVGRLLKEGLIEIKENCIRLK